MLALPTKVLFVSVEPPLSENHAAPMASWSDETELPVKTQLVMTAAPSTFTAPPVAQPPVADAELPVKVLLESANGTQLPVP